MGVQHYLSWLILFAYIAFLLAIDFLVLHNKHKPSSTKKAVFETLFFVANAMFFGVIVYWLFKNGLTENINNLKPAQSIIKFITGYLIELSLSVDNLFVIAMILTAYKIPRQYQHRLLFLGIIGAIVLRGVLITIGLVLIHKIHSISIVFGIFLLYTAFKMLKKEEDDPVYEKKGISKYFKFSKKTDNGRFITTLNGKKVFTTLFGALLTIEFTDLLFALDSIPAIFAVTTDPFIVFSSNIFAIMGLRSMYFLLANMLEKFEYLKYSVFSILLFVALKLITANWVYLPEWFSLMFIGISLVIGVWISVIKINSNKG